MENFTDPMVIITLITLAVLTVMYIRKNQKIQQQKEALEIKLKQSENQLAGTRSSLGTVMRAESDYKEAVKLLQYQQLGSEDYQYLYRIARLTTEFLKAKHSIVESQGMKHNGSGYGVGFLRN